MINCPPQTCIPLRPSGLKSFVTLVSKEGSKIRGFLLGGEGLSQGYSIIIVIICTSQTLILAKLVL